MIIRSHKICTAYQCNDIMYVDIKLIGVGTKICIFYHLRYEV